MSGPHAKIALFIPYFGKWPPWIDLFFDSCISNCDVDFFLFTDCLVPNFKAPNLHFFSISFSDYCSLASEKLGIEFKPETPYKLCDLKPFYGLIHRDKIEDFDFWGFGDLDLVFGDIRSFYTDELLAKYDVLSTHLERVSGHFALFRNNDKYVKKCLEIKNWQKDLSDSRIRILDEQNLTYTFYPELKLVHFVFSWIIKFNFSLADRFRHWFVPILHRVCRTDSRRIRFVEMNIHPVWTGSGNWKYTSASISNNGKACLWDVGKNEEAIYCHFLPFKNSDGWKNNSYITDPIDRVVVISPEGIQKQ